jgi:hypothetical protein
MGRPVEHASERTLWCVRPYPTKSAPDRRDFVGTPGERAQAGTMQMGLMGAG